MSRVITIVTSVFLLLVFFATPGFGRFEHLTKGSGYFRDGQCDMAISEYRKALEDDPEEVAVLYNLAVALYYQDKLEEAEKLFKKAVLVQEDHIDSINGLGYIYYDRKRRSDAETLFRLIVELKPDDPGSYYNWGLALMGQNLFKEAEDKFRQALKIQDRHIARYYLARALQQQGRYEEAIKEYRKTIDQKMAQAKSHYRLGEIYEKQAQRFDALSMYGSSVVIESLCLDPSPEGKQAAGKSKPPDALTMHCGGVKELVESGDTEKFNQRMANYCMAIGFDEEYLKARPKWATSCDEKERQQEPIYIYCEDFLRLLRVLSRTPTPAPTPTPKKQAPPVVVAAAPIEPTAEPTIEPTAEPTAEPEAAPPAMADVETASPTPEPTAVPTAKPTAAKVPVAKSPTKCGKGCCPLILLLLIALALIMWKRRRDMKRMEGDSSGDASEGTG